MIPELEPAPDVDAVGDGGSSGLGKRMSELLCPGPGPGGGGRDLSRLRKGFRRFLVERDFRTSRGGARLERSVAVEALLCVVDMLAPTSLKVEASEPRTPEREKKEEVDAPEGRVPAWTRLDDDAFEESVKDENDGLENDRPDPLGVGLGGGVGCIYVQYH
jgi:hypothetical protein